MIELTFVRALKIWGSYTLRIFALTMLLMAVMGTVGTFLMFTGEGFQPDEPFKDPSFLLKFVILWFAMMIGGFAVQIFALQWALKTQWSDFKIELVPISAPSEVAKVMLGTNAPGAPEIKS